MILERTETCSVVLHEHQNSSILKTINGIQMYSMILDDTRRYSTVLEEDGNLLIGPTQGLFIVIKYIRLTMNGCQKILNGSRDRTALRGVDRVTFPSLQRPVTMWRLQSIAPAIIIDPTIRHPRMGLSCCAVSIDFYNALILLCIRFLRIRIDDGQNWEVRIAISVVFFSYMILQSFQLWLHFLRIIL